MDLEWNATGRLGEAQLEVTDYLDRQVFVWPQYAVQISGVRAGIVGVLQLLPKDSTVLIQGSLKSDGSLLDAVSLVSVTIAP